MAPITGSIEISRPPRDVFDYVTDIERQGEWQSQIVSVQVDTDGPTRIGTQVTEQRLVPGGKRTVHFEITQHDPPRATGFQVTDGPVRPHGTMRFTPLDGGARTRVDFEMEFVGHGLGKLILPLANRDASKHVPTDLQALKARLESQT